MLEETDADGREVAHCSAELLKRRADNPRLEPEERFIFRVF